MRITYVSLPPYESIDPDRYGVPPLAVGCLAAYAQSLRGAKDNHLILDPALLCGNDEKKILELILAGDPQLVAFSTYSWNRVIVTTVTRALAKANPQLPIVLGGPEVAFAPLQALQDTDAWWVCAGEGEIPFAALLDQLDTGVGDRAQPVGMLSRFFPNGTERSHAQMVDPLDRIPSPYTAGLLRIEPGSTADMETMRGCPFKCNFCLYGKNYSNVRYYSLDHVRADLTYLVNSDVASIYILDPTFNFPRERCLEICAILKDLNRDAKKKVFVEVKAEWIDTKMADAFVEAGIAAVEVGLQSINPIALSLMGRNFDLDAFTRGTLLLRERGIWANIGVIAGLPGDSVDHFEGTLRFVSDQALGRLMVYPLQVFPGCGFYKEAERLGLKFEPAPSYQIIETPLISAAELNSIVACIPDTIEELNKPYLREISREVLADLRKLQCQAGGHPLYTDKGSGG